MYDRQVLLLIDSGVTHNFLFKKLVTELRISIQAVKYFVVLRDKRRVRGIGKCEDVELKLVDLAIK